MVIALVIVVAALPGVALTAYGLGLKTGLDERRRFTFGSAPRPRTFWMGRRPVGEEDS